MAAQWSVLENNKPERNQEQNLYSINTGSHAVAPAAPFITQSSISKGMVMTMTKDRCMSENVDLRAVEMNKMPRSMIGMVKILIRPLKRIMF